MTDFLEPGTNFQDIPIKTQKPSWFKNEAVFCPVCKGHGFYNLRIDVYGKGKHFQGACNQCNGWGYVEKGSKDESCIHEYEELTQDEARSLNVPHYGMCYHVYECVKCKRIIAHDSSG